MITFKELPRDTPRNVYKAMFSLFRKWIREAERAATDAMLYGTGMLHIDNNGEVRHLPMSAFNGR